MTLLATHPLANTFDGVYTFQTKGINVSGGAYPSGIPDSFDLVNGVAKITVRDTDPGTYGERRSEMQFLRQIESIGEYWYTWKFMIPSSWNFDIGMAIMQIHETPDEHDPPDRAVQFVLLLENDQLVARVPSAIEMQSPDSYRLASYPFVFDRWHFMCLHANWQHTPTGFWEMFVDNVPMFRQFDIATAYDDLQGAYLKLGIYNFHEAQGWGTKIIYVSDVNIWSGNDGYRQVIGSVPSVSARRVET